MQVNMNNMNNSNFGVPYNNGFPDNHAFAPNPGVADAGAPQVIILQAPKLIRSFEGYKYRLAFYFGAVQIFCGFLSICLGISNPLTCGLYGMVGFGLWGGVIYIVAGTMGILSSMRKTSFRIITHMVMSIIGAVCAGIQLALGAAAAFYDNQIPGCYYYDVPNEANINYNGSVAVDALLACVAIVQIIVAIMASSISCKVICCSSQFTAAQFSGGNGQIPGQVVYYGNQTMIPLGGGGEGGGGGVLPAAAAVNQTPFFDELVSKQAILDNQFAYGRLSNASADGGGGGAIGEVDADSIAFEFSKA